MNLGSLFFKLPLAKRWVSHGSKGPSPAAGTARGHGAADTLRYRLRAWGGDSLLRCFPRRPGGSCPCSRRGAGELPAAGLATPYKAEGSVGRAGDRSLVPGMAVTSPTEPQSPKPEGGKPMALFPLPRKRRVAGENRGLPGPCRVPSRGGNCPQSHQLSGGEKKKAHFRVLGKLPAARSGTRDGGAGGHGAAKVWGG